MKELSDTINNWLAKNENHSIVLDGERGLWTLTITLSDKDTTTSHHSDLLSVLTYLTNWCLE